MIDVRTDEYQIPKPQGRKIARKLKKRTRVKKKWNY